jgi:hypothetical protein
MLKNKVVRGIAAITILGGLLSIALVRPSATVLGAPVKQDADSIAINNPEVITETQAEAVAAYWTPERMAAAQPMDLQTASADSRTSIQSEPVGGTPTLVDGGAPGTKTTAVPYHPSVKAVDLTGLTAAWYSYPFPYDRTSISAASGSHYYPYITVAKVFFTQNGGNYVCSATAAASNNHRVALTAGHCVNAGGSSGYWSYNVYVCPGYYYGEDSRWGCWGIIDEWTTNEWYYYSNLRQDFGAFVTANSSDKVSGRLTDWVGSQGVAWYYGPQNGQLPQLWWQFGYPAAAPFAGNQVISCQSSLAVMDGVSSRAGPDTNGVGCDMTGGSSGGGWVWQFKTGAAAGYLNGHNDYKYISPSWPEAMFSPYYGGEQYAVWNAAQSESV